MMQEYKDKLVRRRQAAETLACSLRTLDRLANSRCLTRVKVRGGVRFRESEIQAIMNGGKTL
jgi:excisionase family DNA binding protein